MRLYRYSPYRPAFDLFDNLFAPQGAGPDAPAYNVERKDDDNFRVVLAVPGFGQDEIDITQTENVLTVTGKAKEQADAAAYVYRGLAAGSFEHRFELGDNVKVAGADLTNGLLKIDLIRVVPEEQKPRKIAIGTPAIENRLTA